jgi:hypothetical protein
LHDGLEWNVRLSAHDNEGILAKYQAAIECLWEEGEFETYRAIEIELRRFDRAANFSTSDPLPTSRNSSKSSRPSAALHCRWRNLVVVT